MFVWFTYRAFLWLGVTTAGNVSSKSIVLDNCVKLIVFVTKGCFWSTYIETIMAKNWFNYDSLLINQLLISKWHNISVIFEKNLQSWVKIVEEKTYFFNSICDRRSSHFFCSNVIFFSSNSSFFSANASCFSLHFKLSLCFADRYPNMFDWLTHFLFFLWVFKKQTFIILSSLAPTIFPWSKRFQRINV